MAVEEICSDLYSCPAPYISISSLTYLFYKKIKITHQNVCNFTFSNK